MAAESPLSVLAMWTPDPTWLLETSPGAREERRVLRSMQHTCEHQLSKMLGVSGLWFRAGLVHVHIFYAQLADVLQQKHKQLPTVHC